jgi:hypothetical protein
MLSGTSSRWPLVALLAAGCSIYDAPVLDGEERARVEANLLERVPPMRHEVGADLGGEVTYLGLDAHPLPVRPGGTLTLVHYFRVERLLFDWELFVHLDRTDGRGRINADHVPVDGLLPARRWRRGWIVRDEHTVDLPGTLREELVVYVGLYRGQERLEVREGPRDDGDRVRAAVLAVEGGDG